MKKILKNGSFDLLNKAIEQFSKLTKSKDEPIKQTVENKRTDFYFQQPIKAEVHNIGAYSPNARTDVRHSHHDGVDLHASRGSAIYSIAPGTVTNIASDSVGGNNVTITHPNGYKSYYAHMDSISDFAIASFKTKVPLDINNAIGTVGNTGNASVTSPHLHLQVWKNGSLIDPASVISVPKPDVQFMKNYKPTNEPKTVNFKLSDKMKTAQLINKLSNIFLERVYNEK
jgi:murein DD-endopeptidase MepM/ murein hydrolase activator NlpD